MQNMAYYVAAVLAQYVIAYGLAILLNQQVRGRKFFRVVFLLPFMLSPVAVSFMIGKTLLNSQYGPIVPALEWLGFTDISFYEDPWLARLNIMIMDAWYSIPFMMVLLLAGLQGIPGEVLESAKIDGASSWQTFRHMMFPLMLPISLTAIILRVIFELKLIDVVRVVTGGGPGGATDTVSLFIYREGSRKPTSATRPPCPSSTCWSSSSRSRSFSGSRTSGCKRSLNHRVGLGSNSLSGLAGAQSRFEETPV